MSDSARDAQNQELMRKWTEVAIHLFVVAVLAFWSFKIFQPFLAPLVTGIVIAVVLHPLFTRLVGLLGGRRKLAATLFILVGIGCLVVPAYLISGSVIDGIKWLRVQEQQDAIHVPPPPAGVAGWPLIGERASALWTEASNNLEETLQHFAPQVRGVASWLLSTLAGLGLAVLMLIVAVVIAAVMLMHPEGGGKAAHAIGGRLGGEGGEAAVDLAVQTVRSVATGVVGVAAVQAALAAIGLFLAGVPAAGVWVLLVLVLAVAQLSPLVVLGPLIVYVAATNDSTLTLVLFTIWSLFVSVSDAFLKPLFLGRGIDIPMPVILIGAIGGMMQGGILGLFVGAVVLSLGYKMFTVWMKQAEA